LHRERLQVTRAASLLALAFVTLALACGGSGVVIGDDAGAASDGSAPPPPTDGAAGSDASSRKKCIASGACANTEYCDHGGSCSTTSQGACTMKPEACSDIYSPTCGCDGAIYGNPCSAAAAGVEVSSNATCPAPTGWIRCGDKYCELHTSYCQARSNGVVPGQPRVTYTCPPLPDSCRKQTDCSCFPQSTPCLSPQHCLPIPSGNETGFEIGCPGG
jgi:hypothetical protein